MNPLTGIFKKPVYELAEIKEAMNIEVTPKQAREEAINRFMLKKKHETNLLISTVALLAAVIIMLVFFITSTDRLFSAAQPTYLTPEMIDYLSNPPLTKH